MPFLGFFLLSFPSVQNCNTNPPTRRKNKQALENKIASAYCMDVKQQKIDLFQLAAKEILNKV
jgi:hypothetical protein